MMPPRCDGGCRQRKGCGEHAGSHQADTEVRVPVGRTPRCEAEEPAKGREVDAGERPGPPRARRQQQAAPEASSGKEVLACAARGKTRILVAHARCAVLEVPRVAANERIAQRPGREQEGPRNVGSGESPRHQDQRQDQRDVPAQVPHTSEVSLARDPGGAGGSIWLPARRPTENGGDGRPQQHARKSSSG